jgi:hypothetical protein
MKVSSLSKVKKGMNVSAWVEVNEETTTEAKRAQGKLKGPPPPSFCSFWVAKRGRTWRSPGLGLELEVVGPWLRLIISLSRVLAMLHGYFRLLLITLPFWVPFHGEKRRSCVLFHGIEQTVLAGAWRRIFVPLVSGAVASEFCSKMAPVSRSLQLQGTTGNLPLPCHSRNRAQPSTEAETSPANGSVLGRETRRSDPQSRLGPRIAGHVHRPSIFLMHAGW